jgi:hypothetical protein
MISWLIKTVLILPRRCKGVPHTYSVHESDPHALRAILRLFLNDRNGGFVSPTIRLPIRAFYVDYPLLCTEEREMIVNRVVAFVTHWILTTGKLEGSNWASLFKPPVDIDGIDTLIQDPPVDLLPISKLEKFEC